MYMSIFTYRNCFRN